MSKEYFFPFFILCLFIGLSYFVYSGLTEKVEYVKYEKINTKIGPMQIVESKDIPNINSNNTYGTVLYIGIQGNTNDMNVFSNSPVFNYNNIYGLVEMDKPICENIEKHNKNTTCVGYKDHNFLMFKIKDKGKR